MDEGPEERRFVVQQHDATRLHWDLRLEHDGVLRSWALPRGIPWNPKENRLAVATEDHGLEFLDWDGDDADPGYGAGRMTTWDSGTFETHKWRDDEVIVTLHGRRATGKFALFSMRGTRDWLIHRMDPPVDPDRRPVPFGVPPMVASEGALPDGESPGGDDWVYEPCWRGVRAMVTDDTGRVGISDATGADISVHFPEVRRIGRALGHRELILDGVIIADVAAGARPDAVERRMRLTSDSGARRAAGRDPVAFVAFDVLWVDGRPITDLAWELRRRQLDDLSLAGPAWSTTPIVTTEHAFELVDDGDGVVAKRRDSPYPVGTTTADWVVVRRPT